MSPPERLDEQVVRLNAGRLGFDPRRRRLSHHGPDGAEHTIEITESQLRGLLHRLLMTAPEPAGGEPLDIAVRLLVEHLDAGGDVAGR